MALSGSPKLLSRPPLPPGFEHQLDQVQDSSALKNNVRSTLSEQQNPHGPSIKMHVSVSPMDQRGPKSDGVDGKTLM
jgi:hypothetical protein